MGCGVQKVTFDWKAIIFGICQIKIHVKMTAFSLYKKSARLKKQQQGILENKVIVQ